MENANTAAHLLVSGFNIYASSRSDLAAKLPITVAVCANNGTTHTFYVGDSILRGGYSPSGNWMAYYVNLTSDEQIAIPNKGATFQISVTVTPHSGAVLSFTESACGPRANLLTCPERMVTGRAYSFTTANAIPVDTSYRTESTLSWYPKMTGYYTTQVFEEGYVDPYTKTENATSSFSTIYFAVANRDGLPGSEAASLQTDAQVNVQVRYLSSDFTDGIVITEMSGLVPCAPRDEVDAGLAPTLTAANVAMSALPSEAVIGGKYLHRQATVTCTPVAQYKYGDGLSYIHCNDTNRYASSISFQAIGVAPGTTYIRPDTGAGVTAGNDSIAGVELCVYGSKWKLPSATVLKTYTVLWYQAPSLPTFSIHRASVSSTSTAYRYNGTYYKKDDFGAYCIIEYAVSFSPMDNTNTAEMVIQYGTHRTMINPGYSQSGFIVVSAPVAQTMSVIIVLYDRFYPYGVSAKRILSTGAILIDFLSGGSGMAVGKVATAANTLDIAPSWKLQFYQATIGAYNGTTPVNLVTWMRDIDARLKHIEDTEFANV